MLLAGLVLVVAPWGWAGVVLWTVAAALGFASAAFFAVFAEARAQRVVMGVAFVGLLAALAFAASAGHESFTYRWLDHVCFPAALLAGASLSWFLLSRDLVSRPAAEARGELLRSVPFWAGVALFAYFAVQDFNAWGVAVDREAFWAAQGLPGIDVGQFDVRLLDHVRWLPSGLNAPFSAADTMQPPMNAWRLMMTLGAPWLLLLALLHGLRRRRAYVFLCWVTLLAALAVGAFGVLNQKSYGTVLGYPVPNNTQSFGTFMNRNHAGVYLYLHAAIALGLTLWHIRRAGDNVFRGGPHLAAAFIAFALALLAALTNSTGGAAAALTLLLVAPPLAYWFGFPGSSGSRRRIMLITGGALALSAASVLFVADLQPIIGRFKTKAETPNKCRARSATRPSGGASPWTHPAPTKRPGRHTRAPGTNWRPRGSPPTPFGKSHRPNTPRCRVTSLPPPPKGWPAGSMRGCRLERIPMRQRAAAPACRPCK